MGLTDSFEGFESGYRRYTRRKKLIIIAMAVIAIFTGILEIALGPYNIDFFQAYRVLIDHILGVEPANTLDDYVVWERSVPRAMCVLIVGAGLGVCGTAMQSALKNPLADPYTTGISSGANLGISMAAVAGIFILPFASGNLGYITNAFLVSLVPAAVIVGLTAFKRSVSPTTMILIGIAVMYIFSACTTMLNLTASDETYAEVYTWSLGTLGSVTWGTLPYILAATLVGIVAFYALHAQLNVLADSDSLAIATGLKPKRARLLTIVIVSLVTATLVCFTGTIGFVGLVAPHIMRIFIGSDNRYLIPASAASGALVLALSDCVAIELTNTGLPVGVVTSLVGGPLFIYILIKQHRKVWN